MKKISSILLITAMLSVATSSFAQEHQKKYCTLSGKITDEENKTVSNAKIILNQNGVQESSWSSSWGTYNMRIYSSETYEVDVFYLGYFLAKREIEIKIGEDRTLDIQVDLSDLKSQSISGKITNKKTGENLVCALVKMTLIQGKENFVERFVRRKNEETIIHTRTLEDGIYSIKGIPTGIYNVRVQCIEEECLGGYMGENMKVEIKKDEKIKLNFQLMPISEACLYGKITDNGHGNHGAEVVLYQNGKKIIGANCDLAGYYYIEHIPVGFYEIRVYDQRMEIEIKEGEKLNLNFQLKTKPILIQ